MKRIAASLLTGLTLATAQPVFADWGGPDRYRHDDYAHHHSGRPPSYYRHEDRGGRGNSAAWGILGAGLALGAIALAVETPRPPPVVVAPPPPPPMRMWYYCESARTYYPYISYCPEGWRAVPAAPY
jgi:hypothetical protein